MLQVQQLGRHRIALGAQLSSKAKHIAPRITHSTNAVSACRAAAAQMSMKAGSSAPQVSISANGKHRDGAARDLTELLLGRGVSITGLKKISLDGRFSMLMSVILHKKTENPLTPAELVRELSSEEMSSALGFSITADLIDSSDLHQDASPAVAAERKLKLSCPQRPGLVLAMTELLKDHGCTISDMDATTSERGGQHWFSLQCSVEFKQATSIADVEAQLKWWASTETGAVVELVPINPADKINPQI